MSGRHGKKAADLDGLLINFRDLLPGDILLFRANRQKPHQKKISAATNSPYTHAAIYLGDGRIAESKFPRVRIKKLAHEKGQVIGVLRSQYTFLENRPLGTLHCTCPLLTQSGH
jgi:cell wall-associated NlpC family hydrolase